MLKIDIDRKKDRFTIAVDGNLKEIGEELLYVFAVMHDRFKKSDPVMGTAFKGVLRGICAEDSPMWEYAPAPGNTDILIKHRKEDKPHEQDT